MEWAPSVRWAAVGWAADGVDGPVLLEMLMEWMALFTSFFLTPCSISSSKSLFLCALGSMVSDSPLSCASWSQSVSRQLPQHIPQSLRKLNFVLRSLLFRLNSSISLLLLMRSSKSTS